MKRNRVACELSPHTGGYPTCLQQAGRSTRPKRRRQRQWTKQHEQQVLHLRQRHRLWGKRKLWKVLCRDQGFTLSTCLQQAG